MYIVFEGIVGSGKSTQSKRLVEHLQAKYPDRTIIYVREPGSTPIAEDIRYLAQGKEWDEKMHPLTNAYLYAASRAQSLATLVSPALAAGGIVIADRSFISSLAYQGAAQWLGLERVLAVNHEAIKDTLPDLVISMQLDAPVAIQRTFDAAGDKWEREGIAFFEKIVAGYEACAKLPMLKNKMYAIDARGERDEIFERICQLVSEKTGL